MKLTELLKQETNENHIATGKSPAFSQLLSPRLTKETYAQIITGWHDFMKIVEATYLQFPQLFNIIPDLHERLKTKLLEKDLVEVKSQLFHTNGNNTIIPSCTTINQLLGILYVIEGSSLGAQFIAKQLRANTNLSNLSFHFYNGYIDETTTKWESFKKWVNLYGNKHPNTHSEMVRSANDCFVCLTNFINSYTKQ